MSPSFFRRRTDSRGTDNSSVTSPRGNDDTVHNNIHRQTRSYSDLAPSTSSSSLQQQQQPQYYDLSNPHVGHQHPPQPPWRSDGSKAVSSPPLSPALHPQHPSHQVGRASSGITDEQRRSYLDRGPVNTLASQIQSQTSSAQRNSNSASSSSRPESPHSATENIGVSGTSLAGHQTSQDPSSQWVQPAAVQQRRMMSGPPANGLRPSESEFGQGAPSSRHSQSLNRPAPLIQQVSNNSDRRQAPPSSSATALGTSPFEDMHDLDRVVALLRSPKFYYEGFLLKKTLTNPDGQPPKAGQPALNWAKYYVQIAGTTLSSWDAAEMDRAAVEGRQVAPSYTNVTDATVSIPQPLASSNQDGNVYRGPTPYLFLMNSAGKNQMLHCCPDAKSLNSWIAAIRLAAWERGRLFEIYTGTLLATRKPAPPTLATSPKGTGGEKVTLTHRGAVSKIEGWLKVRLPGDTVWRRFWTVFSDGNAFVLPSDVVKEKRNKRNSILGFAGLGGHKSTSTTSSSASSIAGEPESFVAFYAKPPNASTGGANEKGKGNQPVVVAKAIYSVAAVYPESKLMVDTSSLFKIEGTFATMSSLSGEVLAPHAKEAKEGFALMMTDEGGCGEMLKWLYALLDVFRLYGRPGALTFDPRDPRSCYFAYPIGPAQDRLFIDRELAENVDILDDRPRDIRNAFLTILFNRMRGLPAAPLAHQEQEKQVQILEEGQVQNVSPKSVDEGEWPPQQPAVPLPRMLPSIGEAAANAEVATPMGHATTSPQMESPQPGHGSGVGSPATSPPPESLCRPSFLADRDQGQAPGVDVQAGQASASKLAASGTAQHQPVEMGKVSTHATSRTHSEEMDAELYSTYYDFQNSQPADEPDHAATAAPMRGPRTAAAHSTTPSLPPNPSDRAPPPHPPASLATSPRPLPHSPSTATSPLRSMGSPTDDYTDVLAALNFADQHSPEGHSAASPPQQGTPSSQPLQPSMSSTSTISNARQPDMRHMSATPPPAIPDKDIPLDEDIYNDEVPKLGTATSPPSARRGVGGYRNPAFLARPPPSKTPSIGGPHSTDSSARTSPANGGFPSSFSASQRGAERVAAAQAAQAAEKAAEKVASTRPGRRSSRLSKTTGLRKGWTSDSDEDEQEDARDEDDDDEGAQQPLYGQYQPPVPSLSRPVSEWASLSQNVALGVGGEAMPHLPARVSSPGRPSREYPMASQQGAMYRPSNNGTLPEDRPMPTGQPGGPPAQFPSASSRRDTPYTLRQDDGDPSGLRPAFAAHGLLGQRMHEKQFKSAHAIQEAAHATGEPLVHMEHKIQPIQSGLVGAIATHEKDRKREGGVGAALTERERDRKMAEFQQRQADEMQRIQMQQPYGGGMSPMGGGWPGMMPPGMMPGMGMMYPGMMGMMGPGGGGGSQMGGAGGGMSYDQMMMQQLQMQQAMFVAQQAYMNAMAQGQAPHQASAGMMPMGGGTAYQHPNSGASMLAVPGMYPQMTSMPLPNSNSMYGAGPMSYMQSPMSQQHLGPGGGAGGGGRISPGEHGEDGRL